MCGGRLRKLYSPVGIVFKGSGFYSTDAKKPKPKAPAASAQDGKSSTSEKSAAPKTESASAAKKEEKSA